MHVNNPNGNPIVYCTEDSTVLLYKKFSSFHCEETVEVPMISIQIWTRYKIKPGRLYSYQNIDYHSLPHTTVESFLIQLFREQFGNSYH